MRIHDDVIQRGVIQRTGPAAKLSSVYRQGDVAPWKLAFAEIRRTSARYASVWGDGEGTVEEQAVVVER